MSSWGNNDNAANAPYWAARSVGLRPNLTNVTSLFDNTTANSFAVNTTGGGQRYANETVGLFAIDPYETIVEDASSNPTGGYVSHAGWNLVTTGQGGRAGRVQVETLVALANVYGDSDGQTYANVSIVLTNPSSGSVISGAANANSIVFSVTPTLTGNTAANLTYQWQVNNGTGAWVNMADGNNAQPAGVQKTGTATSAVTIKPWNTSANGYVFRVVVSALDEGVSATSSNAYITIY